MEQNWKTVLGEAEKVLGEAETKSRGENGIPLLIMQDTVDSDWTKTGPPHPRREGLTQSGT